MIDDTLNERGKRYGDYKTQAGITRGIKQAMASTDAWFALSPEHQEALDAIAGKIGRIINGDPHYSDNWHDIQGYARLGERACKEFKIDWNAAKTVKNHAVASGGSSLNAPVEDE